MPTNDEKEAKPISDVFGQITLLEMIKKKQLEPQGRRADDGKGNH